MPFALTAVAVARTALRMEKMGAIFEMECWERVESFAEV